ncbi:MAG: ABC transporter substrate-binding protein [Egibacteraceae bacterium]
MSISRRRFLQHALAGSAAAAGGLFGVFGGAREVAAQAPARGGTLRVAFSGSAEQESLDPHQSSYFVDFARAHNCFERLVGYNPDLTTTSRLATSVEPNADGTQWRIRLRDGVTWHDGKPLVADDVLYSIGRILDPELALDGAVDLAFVDLANSRRVDDLTVELALSQPIADLASTLAGYTIYIVQDGAVDFATPVGTGPFIFESFRPGEAAVYTRNDNYWEDDLPYLDQLEVLTIVDVSTRENALLGGEVDLADQISPVRAKALAGNGDFGVLESPIGTMRGFVMKLDLPPFDDELVREALKYAVDRQAMVDSVYLGYGEIGNDLYGKGHPFYNDELPQREYDPERHGRCCARPAWRDSRCPSTPPTPPPACSRRRRCSWSRRGRRGSRWPWTACQRTATTPTVTRSRCPRQGGEATPSSGSTARRS